METYTQWIGDSYPKLAPTICENAINVALLIAVLVVVLLVMIYLHWNCKSKQEQKIRIIERLATSPDAGCGNWGMEASAEARAFAGMGNLDVDPYNHDDKKLNSLLASISAGTSPLTDEQIGYV